jgi:hypothetical protein
MTITGIEKRRNMGYVGVVNSVGMLPGKATTMSYATEQSVLNNQWNAAQSQQLPSVLYRPRLMADGDMWIALYGDDLASGVCGCGKTPAEAMYEFDKAWSSQRTPAAIFNANK